MATVSRFTEELEGANMFILADLEATCWENRNMPDYNEVIEIGFIVCNIKGDILASYESFVRPVINPKLSKFCKQLTGIKQKDVESARLLKDVVTGITVWFEEDFAMDLRKVTWASWGDWDPLCLLGDCGRHKIESPFGKHLNLQQLYAELRGITTNLKDAVEREGGKWIGPRHRALSDATNSMTVAKILV